MKKICTLFITCAALAGVSCAPQNWDAELDGAYDPFEKINRATFSVNKGVDTVVAKPAAHVYGVMPPWLQDAVGNFTSNLKEPLYAANFALQKNGSDMTRALGRFSFNTIFGLGGLVDISDTMGIKKSETDLGETIRAYCQADNNYLDRLGLDVIENGCGNGTAYLVLPLMGPSTATDTSTVLFRHSLYPGDIVTMDNPTARNNAVRATSSARALHTRWLLLDTTSLAAESALDEYSFIRDAYEDYRRANTPTSDDLWLQD